MVMPKDVSLGGNLLVNGNLSVNQFQSTTKITTTNYQLVVAEDLSLNGRLNVTQDASMNGNVYVKGNITAALITSAPTITGTYTTSTLSNIFTIHTFTSGTCTFTPTMDMKVGFIVVGGGGGGGGTNTSGGAGGAGGGIVYNKTTATFTSGTTYTITIGAGGTAGGTNTNGGAGTSSSISGGGITITGAGGGGGNGGSNTNVASTGGAGSSSGVSPTPTYITGAAGGTGTNAGTNGTIITDSVAAPTTYVFSGGGGGGGGVSSVGGAGGGGAGAGNSFSPVAGTANTGGGGGGGVWSNSISSVGAAGGSGVVLIYYTANTLSVSSSLNVTGAANIGGSLSIAGGITPLYTTPSFGPGQVGYVYNYSYPASVTSGTNSFNITVPAGVYIAFAYFEAATNQTNNNFYHELKQDNTRMALAFCPQNSGANYQYLTAISAVCVCTNTYSTITQYVNVVVNTNLGDCRFKVARIA